VNYGVDVKNAVIASNIAASSVAAKIDTFNQPGNSERLASGPDRLPPRLSAGDLGAE
jgi:hypothetical protein